MQKSGKSLNLKASNLIVIEFNFLKT